MNPTRSLLLMLLTLFVLCSLPTLTAAQDDSEKPPADDRGWSEAAQKALESPGELSAEAYAELQATWEAVTAPVIKAVCGEATNPRATVSVARTDAGVAYLKFIARGRSAEKVRTPAFDSANARNLPATKAMIAIYVGQPGVVEMTHADELSESPGTGMSASSVTVGDVSGVQHVRGDDRHASAAAVAGDRYLEIEVAAADTAVDVEAALRRLHDAAHEAGFFSFPEELKVSSIRPRITATAEEIKQPLMNRGPGKRTVGADADDEEVLVRISTTQGDILLALNKTKAPLTVQNFLQYVDDEHYDDTLFHRVMANFVIQGGGFGLDRKQKEARSGIPNEWENGLSNKEGTIAMARLPGEPHSATTQFFINVNDNTSLLDVPRDGAGYAVFGRVVQGMDTIEAIKSTPIERQSGAFQHAPIVDVVIHSIRRFEGDPEEVLAPPGGPTRATMPRAQRPRQVTPDLPRKSDNPSDE